MNTGSKISKQRRDANRSPAAERLARRRKASAWLDLLTVHTTNPRVCDRWPGHPMITTTESWVIWSEALARLEKNHPALFADVQALLEQSAARQREMSFEEWRAFALREGDRLSRVRRGLRREQLKAAKRLGYTEGSTSRRESHHAEVAERQTR